MFSRYLRLVLLEIPPGPDEMTGIRTANQGYPHPYGWSETMVFLLYWHIPFKIILFFPRVLRRGEIVPEASSEGRQACEAVLLSAWSVPLRQMSVLLLGARKWKRLEDFEKPEMLRVPLDC